MLHEQYETLLRRGMPEMRLRFKFQFQWENRRHEGHQHGHVVIEADARDLITMHALRWLPSVLDAPWVGDGVRADDRSLRWFVRWGETATVFTGKYGATLLDAILAATEHLEPTPPPSQQPS
jgi:hypothetical protein